MAAPTKFKSDTVDIINAYVDDCPDNLPSMVGVARHLSVTRQTIYKWAKVEDRDDLLTALERIQDAQEYVAIEKGITGEYNATIVKLILAKHGYHDKLDNDVTSGGKEIMTHEQWLDQLK